MVNSKVSRQVYDKFSVLYYLQQLVCVFHRKLTSAQRKHFIKQVNGHPNHPVAQTLLLGTLLRAIYGPSHCGVKSEHHISGSIPEQWHRPQLGPLCPILHPLTFHPLSEMVLHNGNVIIANLGLFKGAHSIYDLQPNLWIPSC